MRRGRHGVVLHLFLIRAFEWTGGAMPRHGHLTRGKSREEIGAPAYGKSDPSSTTTWDS